MACRKCAREGTRGHTHTHAAQMPAWHIAVATRCQGKASTDWCEHAFYTQTHTLARRSYLEAQPSASSRTLFDTVQRSNTHTHTHSRSASPLPLLHFKSHLSLFLAVVASSDERHINVCVINKFLGADVHASLLHQTRSDARNLAISEEEEEEEVHAGSHIAALLNRSYNRQAGDYISSQQTLSITSLGET